MTGSARSTKTESFLLQASLLRWAKPKRTPLPYQQTTMARFLIGLLLSPS
jgi:hypothetical protein